MHVRQVVLEEVAVTQPIFDDTRLDGDSIEDCAR